MNEEQIIREIDNYICNRGGGYRIWYIGIASKPRDRLFNDHNVDEERDPWIFHNCGTEMSARCVERHFLALGCKGDEGGGDHTTCSAYAYKTNSHTRE